MQKILLISFLGFVLSGCAIKSVIDAGNGKYIVNNGAECTVDGSVDYRYEL